MPGAPLCMPPPWPSRTRGRSPGAPAGTHKMPGTGSGRGIVNSIRRTPCSSASPLICASTTALLPGQRALPGPAGVVVDQGLLGRPVAQPEVADAALVVDREADPQVLADVVLAEPEARADQPHHPVRDLAA